MHHPRLAIVTIAVALSVAVIAPAGSDDSPATDSLSLELGAMAKDVAKLVEKKEGGAVAVGKFTGASRLKGSGGPEIQLKLAAALKAEKIVVDNETYRFEVTGNYLDFEDGEKKRLGVKLV